jgi:exonuclease III
VDAQDKNNMNLNRHMMGKFRRLLNNLELKELYLNGRRYTWSNEREQATLERLDRVLSTVDWEMIFPASLLSALSSSTSDHCPLLLNLEAPFQREGGFASRPSSPKRRVLPIP